MKFRKKEVLMTFWLLFHENTTSKSLETELNLLTLHVLKASTSEKSLVTLLVANSISILSTSLWCSSENLNLSMNCFNWSSEYPSKGILDISGRRCCGILFMCAKREWEFFLMYVCYAVRWLSDIRCVYLFKKRKKGKKWKKKKTDRWWTPAYVCVYMSVSRELFKCEGLSSIRVLKFRSDTHRKKKIINILSPIVSSFTFFFLLLSIKSNYLLI